MKHWHYLSAVTQRRMLSDLKLALDVRLPDETPGQQLQRLERVIDLYDGLGMVLSTVPRGRVASDKDIHVTIHKWRGEAESLKRLVTTGQVSVAAATQVDDGESEEEDEEDERPDGYLPSASTGDERADQQYVEYKVLWRDAVAKLQSDPDKFSGTSEQRRVIDKFLHLRLAAQERVVAETRATLNLYHRRLRTSRAPKREKIVVSLGDFVDHLTAIHNEHKANRTE